MVKNESNYLSSFNEYGELEDDSGIDVNKIPSVDEQIQWHDSLGERNKKPKESLADLKNRLNSETPVKVDENGNIIK